MNKCNNCGYCQEHCQCDWECRKCEPMEEEIIEEEPEEPEFIQECGTGEIDDINDIEIEEDKSEEETEDKDDIIYCYD